MPDFPADLKTRVLALERELASLSRRAVDLPDRPALAGAKRQPRLAKTVAGGGTYPARTANPTVYWIVFLDAEYPDAVGNQTLTKVERQSTAIAKCYSLSKTYLPENTVIWVFFDHGHWWTGGV